MIAALSLSGAVFLSYYLLPLRWILPCASVCAAAGFSCFLLRKGERWIYMAFLCLIGAATGFSAYAMHWNRTLRYAEQWDGTEQIVSVQVMETPTQLDHSLRLHVRRTEAPKLDMMLYDYNGLIQNLKPGNTLTVSARLRRADLRYGERSDSLVSKDIYLTGTLTAIEARHADLHSLRTVAALCSKRISDYAAGFFSADTATFMRALMLGDKTAFYKDTALYARMQGAGFMHVVAVSRVQYLIFGIYRIARKPHFTGFFGTWHLRLS